MEDEEEEIIVPITNDLEQKIADVYDVFDRNGSKIVESSDVGSILRALGCCPDEDEVKDMIAQTEDPDAPGFVHLVKFLPVVAKAISSNKYKPESPDQLLKAFQLLDEEKRGFLMIDRLSSMITEEGEAFTQDELDEMLERAIDPYTKTVPYEYYINQILHEPETEETNIYKLAERIEREKPPPPSAPKRFSAMFSELQANI